MESEPQDAQWNTALECWVRAQGEQAEALYWLHNKATSWAQRRNDFLQVPTIILSTLTGFLSATSNLVPMVALGGVSVLCGILGTLNSYFKFSQRSESHRVISLMYLSIYKNIEVELALPISQRTDAASILKDLRTTMKAIQEQAPAIPDVIIAQFKIQFKDGTTSRPIIANGLDNISIFREKATAALTPISGAMAPSPTLKVELPPE
jgi:hypothetical protein